jgi:hypothetical protein
MSITILKHLERTTTPQTRALQRSKAGHPIHALGGHRVWEVLMLSIRLVT